MTNTNGMPTNLPQSPIPSSYLPISIIAALGEFLGTSRFTIEAHYYNWVTDSYDFRVRINEAQFIRSSRRIINRDWHGVFTQRDYTTQ